MLLCSPPSILTLRPDEIRPELEPGEADKCGGVEQAGPQDPDEKTDSVKSKGKVFSGRGTGSDLSYLRLVETCICAVVQVGLARRRMFPEMLRRCNCLDFMKV